VIFVRIDWSESRHGVCILDNEGTVLGKGKVILEASPGRGAVHAERLQGGLASGGPRRRFVSAHRGITSTA
jgi:hypothetical protein